MATPANTALMLAATKLHRAAGIEWKEFINALKGVDVEVANQLLRSPPDQLSMAQGRARMTRELFDLLDKA